MVLDLLPLPSAVLGSPSTERSCPPPWPFSSGVWGSWPRPDSRGPGGKGRGGSSTQALNPHCCGSHGRATTRRTRGCVLGDSEGAHKEGTQVSCLCQAGAGIRATSVHPASQLGLAQEVCGRAGRCASLTGLQMTGADSGRPGLAQGTSPSSTSHSSCPNSRDAQLLAAPWLRA